MVGGETEDEMMEAMQDLRDVGCDFLTVGQYLQPTKKHLKVERYCHPDEFTRYEQLGLNLGFIYVASGPLVRSSYKAGEFFIKQYLQRQRDLSPDAVGEIDLNDIAGSLGVSS